MTPGEFYWLKEDGEIFTRIPELVDVFRARYTWVAYGRVAKNTWVRFQYVRVLRVTGLQLRSGHNEVLNYVMRETVDLVRGAAEAMIDSNIGVKPAVRKNRFNSGKDRYAKKVGAYWVYNVKEWR